MSLSAFTNGWTCMLMVLVTANVLGTGRTANGWQTDPLEELPAVGSDLYESSIVELDVNGSRAYIVKPSGDKPAGPKPWIWYAPSLSEEDGTWTLPTERHAEVVKPLLELGFYFCGVDVGESYGSPKGCETFTLFHRLLVDRYGFAPKACLFPVSRGGLMHYNWAVDHPDLVRCIGGIYPVCALRTLSGSRLERISRAYGMKPAEFNEKIERFSSLPRVNRLAKAGVPIMHLHGNADKVVPLETNSGELQRRYEEAGGEMELVVIEGKGHEFAPEYWKNPRLPEFFRRHGLATKKL